MFKKWKIEIICGERIKKIGGEIIEDSVNKKKIFILLVFMFAISFLFKYQFKTNVNKNKIINSNLNKFIK